jgi:hypothetical protein
MALPPALQRRPGWASGRIKLVDSLAARRMPDFAEDQSPADDVL